MNAVAATTPAVWYVFECNGEDRHRRLSRSVAVPPCSRCEADMKRIGMVEGKDGEAPNVHIYRALASRPQVTH